MLAPTSIVCAGEINAATKGRVAAGAAEETQHLSRCTCCGCCSADADALPDSPPGNNWMALMKQKKAEKEQGVARMVRIKHAVLVIQV